MTNGRITRPSTATSTAASRTRSSASAAMRSPTGGPRASRAQHTPPGPPVGGAPPPPGGGGGGGPRREAFPGFADDQQFNYYYGIARGLSELTTRGMGRARAAQPRSAGEPI